MDVPDNIAREARQQDRILLIGTALIIFGGLLMWTAIWLVPIGALSDWTGMSFMFAGACVLSIGARCVDRITSTLLRIDKKRLRR